MLTPPLASVLASPLLPTPALSSTTDFALTPTPTPVSPLPTPEPASTSAPSSTPACSTPKSVPSAALVEAATTDLAAAGAVKPALTVNTTKKTKKGTLSKSKAKSRFAKALEKKVKEMGVDAERYGAYVQALIQDIGAKEKEVEDINTKLMTASDDEKKMLRASLQSMTGALESVKMSKANTKPRVCLYEVIATARDGLLRRTKLSSDIRKEEGHRRDLNHAVKDANVNVKCKQQLAFNNQDPAQQDAIANDVENAKEEVITKQLEADAQKERVSSLYLERDDFNNALSRMLDATSIVMPFVNLGEIDDDMLQVGITAQSTFMQFCEDWERR
ncbi:hypothetical protein PR003_g26943 [Phytophthora rubi]|uniref:Uncharacterized protein n=6 Tax=Phytophthora TaxID=4783 RepID=A0A6A4C532_9STRA|nr:hypothetical protein PR002_g27958 [Phytophthora rubi]KAE9284106.1 hypothetical protein PR003_g26943 [Phytophthora rubi]